MLPRHVSCLNRMTRQQTLVRAVRVQGLRGRVSRELHVQGLNRCPHQQALHRLL